MTPPFIIRTPCHQAEFGFDYSIEGSGCCGTYERVSGMYCTAPRCFNTWDQYGNPTW